MFKVVARLFDVVVYESFPMSELLAKDLLHLGRDGELELSLECARAA